MNRLAAYIALGAVALIVAVAIKFYLLPPLASGEAVTEGRPAIGAPFTLTDQNGNRVSDTEFRGKSVLVYFGYTYCPDVCPTSLGAISAAMDLLGDKAAKVVPIFISVDPERDRPEQLKDYISNFHPSMIALTGTEDEVREVARAYKIYYAKVREAGTPPDEYLVDHTSITFLMGADGNYVTHFPHGVDAESMAKRIADLL